MTDLSPDHAAADGGSFSSTVRRMFDTIAPRYDAFNRWASLGLDVGWRRAAIGALCLEPSSNVLDIASGTGDVAFAAARQSRRVVGCDFAAEMIAAARIKSAAVVGTSPVFQVARAEQLPYRANVFDGAISAFAMRNVRPVLSEVLAEAHRVLRPQARLVVLEFSSPRSKLVRWGHGLYTGTVVPRIGRALTGTAEPFEYLNRSIGEWQSPEEFAATIRAAGFHDVGYRRLSLGTVALHWGVK